MPLISPLPPGACPEIDELVRFFATTLGFTPNSVLTMQRRPAIARAFIELNMAVMANEGRVTSEQKRLIGLLASSVAGCRYCQAHTALAAERFGAPPARLEALWDYASSPLFTEAERAAFDFAVAAAAVPNAVTTDIGEALARHWDEGEIVEIMGVVALFGFLNRWNDSMGTTLEDAAARLAESRLGAIGWDSGKHA